MELHCGRCYDELFFFGLLLCRNTHLSYALYVYSYVIHSEKVYKCLVL